MKQIPIGPMQNFAYIIGDEKEAAVIDPGFESEKILKIAKDNNLEIKKILLTHTHHDHIGALPDMVAATHASVYVHKKEEQNLPDLQTDIMPIEHETTIKIGTIDVHILLTPGHSQGGITYQVGNNIFTGDALFMGRCGRTDLEGGNPDVMYQTLQKLKQLPDDTEVYPGHDYGEVQHATIAHQKQHNIDLLSTKEEFLRQR